MISAATGSGQRMRMASAKSRPITGRTLRNAPVLRAGVHLRDAELGIHDVDAERGALDQFGKRLLALG